MATQEQDLKSIMKRISPAGDPAAESLLDSLGGNTSGSNAAPAGSYGKLSTGTTSSIQDRALELLGAGISTDSVASALGVTPSRISQLLAEEAFSNKVADIRYQNLQKHNLRDAKYDTIEDKLLVRLEDSIPLLFKPADILRAVAVMNGAKRRGQASPDQIVSQQNIVNLILPEVIAQKFTVNINNQVTRAGEQELHTMDASSLLKKVERTAEGTAENIDQELLPQASTMLTGGIS